MPRDGNYRGTTQFIRGNILSLYFLTLLCGAVYSGKIVPQQIRLSLLSASTVFSVSMPGSKGIFPAGNHHDLPPNGRVSGNQALRYYPFLRLYRFSLSFMI